MTNQELYAEIKELREDVKTLHKDFYIFKGKAFGFISVLVGLAEMARHFLAGK